MTIPNDGGFDRDVTEQTLEETARLIVAVTTSEILNDVMGNVPGTPEFECDADRQRVIAWLEHRSSVRWADVNLTVPPAPDSIE